MRVFRVAEPVPQRRYYASMAAICVSLTMLLKSAAEICLDATEHADGGCVPGLTGLSEFYGWSTVLLLSVVAHLYQRHRFVQRPIVDLHEVVVDYLPRAAAAA